MKNCKSIERKLTAYLHGELKETDVQALEAHLETCAACRAELELQRATLDLLGASLQATPAPGWLIARTPVRRRKSRALNAFERIWYGPQLKAVLGTCVIFAFLFMLSGSFVVFNVAEKDEVSFCAHPAVERPKMKLKKPQVNLAKSAKPKPTSRIVTKVNRSSSMPEIEMPEMEGISDGFADGTVMLGAEVSAADVASSDAHDYSFMDQSVEWPRMAVKKLQVPASISKSESQPKLRKQITVNSRVGITDSDIKMPEVAGVKGGTGYLDESRSVGSLGFSMPEDDLFGSVAVDAASMPIPAPVTAPATPVAGALISNFDWMDAQPQIELAVGDAVTVVSSSIDIDRVELKAEPEPINELLIADGRFAGRELLSEKKMDGLERDKDLPVELRRKAEPAVFNPYTLAVENAFSTFSIDVDTAAYGLARNRLLGGGLPEPEQVRTEEFINSFDYDYRPPSGKQTFAVHSAMAPSPFRMGMDVLKLGIKGRRIGRDDHRGAVLTLVIDTSGSMATPERLGLVKESLAMMIEQLNPEDKVAIVQFGGEARLVLEHTPASEKTVLLEAINALQPGGPTQFDKGLELGYQLARSGYSAGDSNRIMILSDGVANLGELDPDAILEQVAEQRKQGIYLSVLGFGAGTYDDDMLEQLANKGDGMYAYIDTPEAARHQLVDQLAATLHVIGSDVKIQVEFNPARVLRYRQLGYENRQLTKEQFRDDTVDAGEVGSGQSVTALYDVELKADGPQDQPVATVYVRYRRADNGAIEEISSRVADSARVSRFEDAEPRFRLAVCTAEFAEYLRRSPYAEGTALSDILGRLQPVALELDLDGQVQELVRLISIADGLEK